MRRRYLVSALAVVFALGLCAPGGAAILSDDFTGDSGALNGQTATTGQVWAVDGTLTSLDTGSQFGQSSVGAGNDSSTTGWKGSLISLGQIANNGTIVVSADLKKQHQAGTVPEMAISFKSSGQNKETAVNWKADWLTIGGSWTYGGGSSQTGVLGDIHVDMTFTLVSGGTNTLSVYWYDIANPSTNGTITTPTPYTASSLNYDTLKLEAYTTNSKIVGFDNVVVTPEPVTLGLLGIGSLVSVLLRRRR